MKRGNMRRGIVLGLLVGLLVSSTVLAASYSATITVTESSGSDYAQLPISFSINNTYLADNGFIGPSGLDTRMLSGLTELPHMVVNDRTLFVSSIAADAQSLFSHTTGSLNLTSFSIIPGYDGYITTADNATLELGDNFTIEQRGRIDTDNGTDKDLVHKPPASFRTFVSPTVDGSITSTIGWDQDGLRFDGAADYAQKAAGVVGVGGATMSVEALFNPDTIVSLDSIVNIGDVATTTNIRLRLNEGKIEFTGYNGAAATCFHWTSTNTTSANVTYYITATYDSGASPRTVVYVNGVVWGGTDAGPGGSVATPNTYMDIGTENNGAAEQSFFDGLIGEVRTSTSTRTFVDHLAFVSTGILSDDGTTVSVWHFAEGSGATLNDAAGNNDLTIVGAAWAISVSVTATGVSSGEYTVTTEAAPLLWAPGDVLKFDGTATSYVDLGITYNASQKLWVDFWFKLDTTFTGGFKHRLWSKAIVVAVDSTSCFLETDGSLRFRQFVGSVQQFMFSYNSGGTWNADQWYHVHCSTNQTIAGGAASDGARLRVDNGAALTDAANAPIPDGGTFYLGTKTPPGADGIVGTIANLTIGTDDLSAAEETALYLGTAPGDETDLWYIGEGTGTNIISYGTAANAGTAGAACTWDYETRPCKFTISIDGTVEDGFAGSVSVPDTSDNWTWMQGNSLIYADNITMTIDGIEVLKYEPEAYIRGVNLPDLAGGTQNGTFIWGSNPTGITVSVGALLPYTPAVAEAWAEAEVPGFTPTTESLGPTTTPGVEGEGFPFYYIFKDLLGQWHDLGGPDISMPYFWKIVAVVVGWLFGTGVMLTTRNVFFGIIAYFIGFAVPAGAMGGVLDLWVPVVYGLGALSTSLLVAKWGASSL